MEIGVPHAQSAEALQADSTRNGLKGSKRGRSSLKTDTSQQPNRRKPPRPHVRDRQERTIPMRRTHQKLSIGRRM